MKQWRSGIASRDGSGGMGSDLSVQGTALGSSSSHDWTKTECGCPRDIERRMTLWAKCLFLTDVGVKFRKVLCQFYKNVKGSVSGSLPKEHFSKSLLLIGNIKEKQRWQWSRKSISLGSQWPWGQQSAPRDHCRQQIQVRAQSLHLLAQCYPFLSQLSESPSASNLVPLYLEVERNL